MYRAILVPLDGSRFGEAALPTALELARRTGATLHLAHARTQWPMMWNEVAAAPVLDVAAGWAGEEEYLRRISRETREALGREIVAMLLNPPVPDALAAYAAANDVGLIVMTTHGRGGLSRAWLGSVASELVRAAAAPVLLIRPGAETRAGTETRAEPEPAAGPAEAARPVEGGPGGSAAVEEAPLEGARPVEAALGEAAPLAGAPLLPKHVIVPLDGSARSEAVLPHAVALGDVSHARYTLVHVLQPAYVLTAYSRGAIREDSLAMTTLRERAEDYLSAVADRMRAEGTRVDYTILASARPAEAILEYARTAAASLIAMSTHGYGAFGRLAFGSVADKVVRAGDLPVLALRTVGAGALEEEAAGAGATAAAAVPS